MIITETARLIVRHFHIFDLEPMRGVFEDPDVMHYGPGVQTNEQQQQWLSDCLLHYQSWGVGPYALVEKSRHAVIGYCGLFYLPDINGRSEIELGYRLMRTAWGQGYATEAARAVRDMAFEVLCLPRLVAMIDPDNGASIRVAEKLGMHPDGEVMFPEYSHPDRLYVMANPYRA